MTGEEQFKELYLSLNLKFRPAPIRSDVMCIDEVVKLSGYSKASIYKFTHRRLIPFHKPAHGGRRLVFIRQEVEEWMKQSFISTYKYGSSLKNAPLIVLAHETYDETVDILGWMIEYLQNEGYTFGTLDTLESWYY